MNLLVDTNILLYAIDKDSPRYSKACAFLEERRFGDGFCVTWSVLYEFLRVATHPKVFRSPLSPADAQSFIDVLIRDPRVDVLLETPGHERFLAQILEDAPPLRGNIWHDTHIAALMLEHGIKNIATADRHFRLFPFLRASDPTN